MSKVKIIGQLHNQINEQGQIICHPQKRKNEQGQNRQCQMHEEINGHFQVHNHISEQNCLDVVDFIDLMYKLIC